MSALTTLTLLSVLSLPLAQTNAAPLDSGSAIADTVESLARKAEAANLVDYSDMNQTIAVVLVFLITGLTVAFCYSQTAKVQMFKARLRSAEAVAMARDEREYRNRFRADDPTDIDEDSEIDLSGTGLIQPPKKPEPQLSPDRRDVLQRAFAATTPYNSQRVLERDIAAIDSGDIG